jgi:anti-anti-sigma factor
MLNDPAAPARGLNFHVEEKGDAAHVRCTGRLVVETTPILRSEVKPLLLKKRRITLDLTDLAQVDSAGLGSLVGLYISAKGANCRLELVNLSPRIRELLSMTNLLSVFETTGRSGFRMP